MPAPDGPIVLICGVRADGTLRALEITDDDFLKMAFNAAAQGLVGGHGWIDSAWQKNPLAVGYSDTLRTSWADADLPAGASYVDSSAVPAGEIWVVDVYTFVYIGSTATVLRYAIRSSSVDYYISETASPPNNIYTSIYPNTILKEGDILRLRIITASLHDKLYGYALGRKIDIDQ